MAFDIHQRIFDEDGDYDENAMFRYCDELMSRFAASPEAQEVESKLGAIGWAHTFMDWGMRYLRVSPADMMPADIEEVLFDIFPRKISAEPGAGEQIIVEMRAFWAFLQREFQLAHAAACLKMLKNVDGKQLDRELQDPANFDMAKSFMMLGFQSGFDMSSEKDLEKFTEVYNAGVEAGLAAGSLPAPPFHTGTLSPSSHPDLPETHGKTASKKAAHRRKMAKLSRRNNRKK